MSFPASRCQNHLLTLKNRSKNYIRVVTGVRGEWLLDIAPNYYDISTFPKGDVKTALLRIEERVRRREKMKGGK